MQSSQKSNNKNLEKWYSNSFKTQQNYHKSKATWWMNNQNQKSFQQQWRYWFRFFKGNKDVNYYRVFTYRKIVKSHEKLWIIILMQNY